MSKRLPCPNPTCSHVFPAQEVLSAKALTCPSCGQVFQFAPKPVVRADAGMSGTKKNVPSPSMRKPQTPPTFDRLTPPESGRSAPLAVPVERAARPNSAESAIREFARLESAAASPNDVISRHHLRRRLKKWLIGLIAVGAAGSALVGAFFAFQSSGVGLPDGTLPGEVTSTARESAWHTVVEVRNQKNATEKACRLVLPKNRWDQDPELKQRLGVAAAYTFHDRNNPHKVLWCAVQAKDFGTHMPREAEMLRLGIERLEQHFGETLETENRIEPTRLKKREAQHLMFRGQVNSVVWWGDMIFLSDRGIGYWLFLAAPTRAQAAAALQEIDTETMGFFVENDRRSWSEQALPTDTFVGINGLTLKGPEGIFAVQDSKQEDERALLFLFGRYLKDQNDIFKNRKNAHVIVLGLDRAGDASAAFVAAKNYVEADFRRIGKEYTLIPAEEKKVRDPVSKETPSEEAPATTETPATKVEVGKYHGQMGEFQVELQNEVKRYILLVVLNQEDMSYAFRCECPWESRTMWRQDFLDLLGTLQLPKVDAP